jgi:hypothetical protein
MRLDWFRAAFILKRLRFFIVRGLSTMRANILSGLLLSISVLAVSACTGHSVDADKTAAPTPPASMSESNTLTANDTLTPMSVTTTTTSSTTSPAPLSIPPVTTSAPGTIEDRMARLENAVGSLRSDYDRIMPAFASLNTTNERIQTLLDEIEQQNGGAASGKSAAASAPMSKPIQPFKTTQTTTTVTQSEATTSPTAGGVLPPPGSVSRAAPTAATTTTKVVETRTEATLAPSADVMKAMDEMTPAAASSTAAVTGAAKGVRVGEHANKTRLVIDLAGNAKPDVSYDLDNTEKLLLVDLPGTTWGGAKSGTTKSSAFVSGWTAQDGANGGSNVAVQLKKGAKILSTEYLKAQGKDPARLVIDLGPAT